MSLASRWASSEFLQRRVLAQADRGAAALLPLRQERHPRWVVADVLGGSLGGKTCSGQLVEHRALAMPG